MTIELDRTDLINLVKGTSPTYELMNNEIVKRLGSYCGGFNDSWSWNYTFPLDVSDNQLYEIYKLLKR